MQVIAKPKPILPPFMKKACLECTNSCPNWCYDGLFPPIGPPPPLTFPNDTSYKNTPTFSPLVIAIIGILASALLLVSYYAIISKYCGKSQSQREVQNNEEIVQEDFAHSARLDPSLHEPWIIVTPGLDEALIKSITMVKYKKGDGLVGSSDCSVCLGEFLEDDTLRLLPKCSHAFHVACIDTWLRSHSNCPLCRANIISTFATNQPLLDNNISNNDSVLSRRYGVWNQPLLNNNNSNNNNSVWSQSLLNNNSDNSIWSHQSWNQSLYDNTNPPLVVDNNGDSVVQDNNTLVLTQGEIENFSSIEEGRQMGFPQTNGNLPKSNQIRALSDLGVRCNGARDTIRRSVSMDHQHDIYEVSNPNVVRYNLNKKDSVVKFIDFYSQSLNLGQGESSKISFCSNDRINEMLNCVNSSVAMKRSFSSGRFSFTKQGKENT